MSIKENNKRELGTSADSIFHIGSGALSSEKKLLKILLISENSSDIYMINKLLSRNDGYIVYDVPTLSGALKVINYLNLDLILIDDMLSNLDGYEVNEKLNHIEFIKDIPKILLLTVDYKREKKESVISNNIDFVKKPFDSVIFKLRVKSLITQNAQKTDRRSYFKQLAQKKFEEATAEMSIYQEIFETSESIMCIYDAKKGKVVESNAVFEKFFLNLTSFNRIISNPRLARKFVTTMDEANYLNYYEPKEWMSTLISGGGFTYLVKLQRDFKEYSFNIFVKQVLLGENELYLIRLSNVYDYLPQKASDKVSHKLQLKEKNLEVFKTDFLKLREALTHKQVDNTEVDRLLYQLGTKLSIVCDDASIIEKVAKRKESNVYFILVQLLKDKFIHKNIAINGQKVHKLLEENSEEHYGVLNADAFNDLIFSLLNNYYGSTLNMQSNHEQIEIILSINNALLSVKIKLDERESAGTIVDKIFTRPKQEKEENIVDSLPKVAKKSLLLLQASITRIKDDNQSILSINIPLKK